MRTIAVIGLGIIGGSICAALTNAGYTVHGYDLDDDAVAYALDKGYIQEKAGAVSDYDTVFLALPPMATLDYLRNGKYRDGALVCDICGVKTVVEKAVYECSRNYRYVGLHPMAGKETSGIASASAVLFENANLIITLAPQTDSAAVEQVKAYAQAMGFGQIITCSAEIHDEKIALTSQLAHIVSNAYVKSEQVQDCDGFTGGSFQDMTRIAGVDERVWTPLYACNRQNVLRELDLLIANLSVYREALREGDDEALSKALAEGRRIRETIKRKNN